jgi:hypothetical protein
MPESRVNNIYIGDTDVTEVLNMKFHQSYQNDNQNAGCVYYIS